MHSIVALTNRQTGDRSFIKVNFDIDSSEYSDEKVLESALRSGIISGQLKNLYVQPDSLTFRPVVGMRETFELTGTL